MLKMRRKYLYRENGIQYSYKASRPPHIELYRTQLMPSCIRQNVANYLDKLILPAHVHGNTLDSVVPFYLLYEIFFLTTPQFLNCSYIHQSYNVIFLLG